MRSLCASRGPSWTKSGGKSEITRIPSARRRWDKISANPIVFVGGGEHEGVPQADDVVLGHIHAVVPQAAGWP